MKNIALLNAEKAWNIAFGHQKQGKTDDEPTPTGKLLTFAFKAFLKSITVDEVNNKWFIFLSAGDGYSQSRILQTSPSFKSFYLPVTHETNGMLTYIISIAHCACDAVRTDAGNIARTKILELNDTKTQNSFALSLWKKDLVLDVAKNMSIDLKEVPKAIYDALDTQKQKAQLLYLTDISQVHTSAKTNENNSLNNRVKSFINDCFDFADNDDVIRAFDLYNLFKESKYYTSESINNFIDDMKVLNFSTVFHTQPRMYKKKLAFTGLKIKNSV
jgi:hypothetical protein